MTEITEAQVEAAIIAGTRVCNETYPDSEIVWPDYYDEAGQAFQRRAMRAALEAAAPHAPAPDAVQAAVEGERAACIQTVDNYDTYGECGERNDLPAEYVAKEIAAALRARSAAPVPTVPPSEPWQPLETAPRNGTPINVRAVSTYRWQPYKPDGQRQMKRKGRWQIAGEYAGWENCADPVGDWQPVKRPGPPVPTGSGS